MKKIILFIALAISTTFLRAQCDASWTIDNELFYTTDFDSNSIWTGGIFNDSKVVLKPFTGSGNEIETTYANVNIEAGKEYPFEFDVFKNSGGIKVYLGGNIHTITSGTTGIVKFNLVAGSLNNRVIIIRDQTDFDIEIEGFTIGNDSNTNINNGELTIDGGSVNQEITDLTAGKFYTIEFDLNTTSEADIEFTLGGHKEIITANTGIVKFNKYAGNDGNNLSIWSESEIKIDNLDIYKATDIDPLVKGDTVTIREGDFSSSTHWGTSTGVNFNDGTLKFASINGRYEFAQQTLSNTEITSGEEYIISFDIIKNTGGNLAVYLGGEVSARIQDTSGKKFVNIKAGTDNTDILILRKINGIPYDIEVDNIEIYKSKGTTNIVSNGDFSTNSYWNTNGGIGRASEIDSGSARLYALNETASFFQRITSIIPNGKYMVNFTVNKNIGQDMIKVMLGGDTNYQSVNFGNGTHSIELTAGNINNHLNFSLGRTTQESEFRIDNISLIKVLEIPDNATTTEVSVENGDFSCAFLTSEKVTEINNVKLYPNPVKNILNINVTNNTSFKVYNTLGKEIKNGFLYGGNNTISVNNLNKGIYFISINNTKGSKNYKFIKN